MSSDQEQGIFDESQYIVEPNENDVLCGRGGMSNHHTGNEWYRRLIRSNRPLYRACPKHTKLLVAKAIVQAVEEQGGRFLERARKTGMFYQVSYKRAVDKTSQGLRERDKDGDGPNITTLPASLQARAGAKIPKPNLSDLAQVTMAHAGMTPTRSAKPPPQAMAKVKQEPIQNNFNNMAGGGRAAAAPPIDDVPPQPGFFSSESMFRMLSRLGGGESNKQPARNSFAQPPNNVPMPSTGPGISSFFGFGGGNRNNNNNNPSEFNVAQQRNSFTMQQQQKIQQQQQQVQQQQQLQLQQKRLAEMQQSMAAGSAQVNNNDSNESAAPPLNRLTTQVSDWLTSFWPVNKQDGASSAAAAAAAIAADGDTGVNSVGNDLSGSDAFSFGNMQQSKPQNSMDPPLMAMQSQQMMQQGFMGNQREPQGVLTGAGIVGGATMPQGQLGAAQLSTAFGNNNESVAPPAALESSISTTLLKLASSPSKIFSGISTFFNSEQSAAFGSDQPNNSGVPPPPAGLGMPAGRRSSRKSSDLLDDYEPDELEERLRQVSGS